MNANTRASLVLGSVLSVAVFTAGAALAAVDDSGRRAELAAEIVAVWGSHVESTYGIEVETWSHRMTATFESAALEDLERAVGELDFISMSDALLGRGGEAVPLALGDPDGHLVYTPIVACRIVDTRLAGGPIGHGGTRNFVAATPDSFAPQGGVDDNCGIPLDVSAVTINLGVARPATEGYLTVHPANSPRPLATSLSFQGEDRNDSSGTVLALCSGGNCQPDFSTYAHRQADVVIDVTGYYAPPPSTALDCVTATESGQLDLLGGLQPRSVECPAGYSATGGGCGGALGIGVSYSRPSMSGGQSRGWSCGLFGSLVSVLSYEVSASCCRVPGH